MRHQPLRAPAVADIGRCVRVAGAVPGGRSQGLRGRRRDRQRLVRAADGILPTIDQRTVTGPAHTTPAG